VVSAAIVGCTRTHYCEGAVKGADLTLTESEVAMLEAPYSPQDN
jgi:hypothetical protein